MTEPRDTSLNDKKLSDLYQQGDKAEPPAALDTLIQAAAHDSVKKVPATGHTEKSKNAATHRRQSWFALAAVVALVAIVIPVMQDESEQLLSEPEFLQPSSDKLSDREQDAKPTVAESVMAQPAVAPATAPALSSAPQQGLLKSMPEKKTYRKRSSDSAGALIQKEERQKSTSLKAKQRAYSSPLSVGEAEKGDTPLAESASMADQPLITPAIWQQQVRQLLQNGQLDKARTRLLALQKAWPDFGIEPDLLRQAGLLPVQPAKTDP